jgi:hypothetical protein
MDAIEFISRYPDYINQLENVGKQEYVPVVQKLKEHDSLDILKPENYFKTELEEMGVVFKLFLKNLNQNS